MSRPTKRRQRRTAIMVRCDRCGRVQPMRVSGTDEITGCVECEHDVGAYA